MNQPTIPTELIELQIRNTPDGMIWQVYHCTLEESKLLEINAKGNGFAGFSREHELINKETWPNWRTETWTKMLEDFRLEKPKEPRNYTYML